MSLRRSILIAVGVLIAGFIVGAAVMAAGHPLMGMLLGFSAVPLALVAWVMAGDRY